jgi:hypothetical protein
VVVVPERCRHCEQPLPETAARRRARVWRHQVVELLPLAVRGTGLRLARVIPTASPNSSLEGVRA